MAVGGQSHFAVVFRLPVAIGDDQSIFDLPEVWAMLTRGIQWIIPVVETAQFVDIRVITINILSQEVMTEDNVPCRIDGVLFYKIEDAKKAVLEVENYNYAITLLAQSAVRDVCGKAELDTILSKREEMGENIRKIVETETRQWGHLHPGRQN